jgi:preprotein translocase subunit SecE
VFNKLIQFLKEVRTELKRVSWPNREQVINSTAVVLVTVVVVATFLWVVDIGLQGLISKIIQ